MAPLFHRAAINSITAFAGLTVMTDRRTTVVSPQYGELRPTNDWDRLRSSYTRVLSIC